MKTITEFAAQNLKDALTIKRTLLNAKRAELQKPKEEPAPVAASESETPVESTVEPAAEPASVEVAPVEAAPAESVSTPDAEVPVETAAASDPAAPAADPAPTPSTEPVKFKIIVRNPPPPKGAKGGGGPQPPRQPKINMREVEEAIREPLKAAIIEAYKCDEEKALSMIYAMECVDHARVQDLKRIVVLTVDEKEKAPQHAIARGEKYFLAEYLPPLPGRGPRDKRGRRGPRDGRPGDRKFGKGRRGRGGRRDGRDGGRPGQDTRGGGEGDGQQRPRRRRFFKPRGNRPEGGSGAQSSGAESSNS